jgi:hypothetical protein
LAKYGREITASLVSVHTGNNEDKSKDSMRAVRAELDGFSGDKHQSYTRVAYEGESVPAGTKRRNDRQWSAVSLEELAKIQQAMELGTPLTA